ncbi:GTPase HflX [Polycladomyces subterraneus]|uniref:GTPase HflX n=1 Tax=Polycladomyces subterraneus TaxID=1016997 RepID=A0ABT8IM66_9BACL|nr:GTPase HflX [Polycladomyces subterraneus]MDN4593848.1 GTPase HflX [Polycladomyces subterraneus]
MVGCGSKRDEWEMRSSLEELSLLADTARAEVVATFVQFRDKIDPAWFIGRGKAEEIAREADEQAIDLVVFDRELTPAQLHNLERLIPCKVIDRTQLILDIFAMRAQTKEGRLQVELAQLQYLLPRLSGRGKELSRLGGGIGTRGPGETQLETDRRHIRRRIRDIRRELEQVKKHRALHQTRRRKNEILQVAIVGYTNAGKSTLLNRLTDSDVLAEDRLFATLDPTSRVLPLPSGEMVLLTDTVGFIRHLPHQLVAAFRSTLKQVKEADLLLHVVDMSHPEAQEQIGVVEAVLEELGASHLPVLLVFNKADQVTQVPLLAPGRDAITISAFSDKDLERLVHAIDARLHDAAVIGRAEIPAEKGDWLALLHRRAQVQETEMDGSCLKITFRMPKRRFDRLPSDLRSHIQILSM